VERFVSNLAHAGVLLGGLAALLALLHLEERTAGRLVARRLGWRAVLVTAWIGVPLHELGHLLAALLFRHRIVDVSFFDPDPRTGTLGYVRHGCSRRSVYQILGGFPIGVAPVVTGGLALAGLLAWMLPPSDRERLLRAALRMGDLAAGPSATGDLRVLGTAVASSLPALVVSLAHAVWGARTALLPAKLYLCAGVASHLAPSGSDLAGAAPGALLFALLVVVGAAVAAALGTSFEGATSLLAPALALVAVASVFEWLYAATVVIAGRVWR
jgi:hypothetical protein